jgi:hypothetical protein
VSAGRHDTTGNGRVPLRAADWRFLLPHPEHGRFQLLVLLGGSPGLAERIVELGLADTVVRDLPTKGSADAVAVFRDARMPYGEVAECLRPGGALYYEIDRSSPRRLATTPRRACDALRRVGLSPTGVYVVGPSLRRPRVYVPLEAPAALGWYLRTLYNPWTFSVACRHLALRTVADVGRGQLASLVPHFAITAVAGDPASRRASVLGLPVLPTDLSGMDLYPLVLTSTHQETLSQRVVILPFTRESQEPVAVVKVSKLSALNAMLEKEQATMADLRRRLDPVLRRSIPEPLRVERWDSLAVATESYRAGESLQRSTSRWGRRLEAKLEDLRLATAWLAEFHRQTEVRRTQWGEAERSLLVDGAFRAYRQRFGATEREEQLFATTSDYARAIDGTPLPIVLRKPDFFGSNVIRSGDELSVVDWESPQHGPALCDLLRFVAPWSAAAARVHGDRTMEHFRTVFFSADRADVIANAVQQALAYYLDRLSMDDRLVPLLLVHTWIDRALHHYDKQMLQGERPTDARAGNRHIDRVAVLAEHANELFSSGPGDRLAE